VMKELYLEALSTEHIEWFYFVKYDGRIYLAQVIFLPKLI
jgi:hypothetical protein